MCAFVLPFEGAIRHGSWPLPFWRPTRPRARSTDRPTDGPPDQLISPTSASHRPQKLTTAIRCPPLPAAARPPTATQQSTRPHAVKRLAPDAVHRRLPKTVSARQNLPMTSAARPPAKVRSPATPCPPARPPAHVRLLTQDNACILPPAWFSVSYFKTPEVLNVLRAQSKKKQSLRKTLCALFSYARCRLTLT